MKDSFQDVYAKYLQHADYGYPLRMPEPMSGLPQNYKDDGLQIGDVGIVNSMGQFRVLFNIHKRSDNSLHDVDGVPENFEPVPRGEVNSIENAIPARPIHSHGITEILRDEPGPFDYEFRSSTPAGAILILPRGANSVELLSTKQFREVATKNALDWYKFAENRCDDDDLGRSLYLITGFYKARSWSLGSFNNPTDGTGKIQARKHDNSPNTYQLRCEFSADCRHGDSESVNQTVFITGFKITVSGWLRVPVVLKVTESETTWSALVRLLKACLNRLRGSPGGGHNPRAAISVEHSPQLSQPFHPSDVINRFLLSKNPNARVAITHDAQWMDMIKGGLTREDLVQEDRLEKFLTQHYTIAVAKNATVFLQGKVNGATDSVVDPPDTSPKLEISDPSTSEPEVSPSSLPELEVSHPGTPNGLEFPPLPTPPLDNPRIVITRIRAQNIHLSLKHIPVGFYVLVRFDGVKRRTRNKSIRLNDSGIEWEDETLLPSKAFETVQFTIYASSEIEPMLGNGEPLYTSESRVEELVGGTCLITLSPGELATTPEPSLLITLGRWYSKRLAVTQSGDDSSLNSEEPSILARETNLAQEALLRYYDEFRREDLENAVQHFECAWRNCPLTDHCRAVVLVNLAKAKFISYQIDPTSADLDDLISLYRQALDLRLSGHPDRPVTLLQLAQALLFHYERQRCNKSISDVEESFVADEIKSLMAEVSEICHGDSFEFRAASLVLQTLKRYQVLAKVVLVELGELVSELESFVEMPPLWHFDRPYRMINLSAVLCKLFELTGKLGHLEKSISVIEEAAQLISDGHFDKPWVLFSLGDALCVRFTRSGNVTDLDRSISMLEGALKFIPGRHPARPWVATRLGTTHLMRFISGSVPRLKISIFVTTSAAHLLKVRLRQLNSLPRPTVAGTCTTSDRTDLEQAILRHREVAGILADGNPHKPGCLTNLASSLLIRFWCLRDRSDLDEAISRHRDAIMLSPDDHHHLNNLALSLGARFQHFGDFSDRVEAISKQKAAVALLHDGPNHLNNLGHYLVVCFKHISDTRNNGKSISDLMIAIKPIPDVYLDKPSHLNNLAFPLGASFQCVGEIEQLGEIEQRLERWPGLQRRNAIRRR